jgi:drug/metabolite transporter (DMT)-like permease
VREMQSSRTLKTKTYIVLLLMVSVGTLGNVALDKGMKDAGTVDISSRAAILKSLLQILTSRDIWTGIALMLAFMVCHMLVLSWADFSFVMPFSAVSYALVPLAGYFWLGEAVHPARWAGIALIVLGVLLVSRTPPRTIPVEADSTAPVLR